jgi:hypothetical protein
MAFTKLGDILVSPNVQGLGTVTYSVALRVFRHPNILDTRFV